MMGVRVPRVDPGRDGPGCGMTYGLREARFRWAEEEEEVGEWMLLGVATVSGDPIPSSETRRGGNLDMTGVEVEGLS